MPRGNTDNLKPVQSSEEARERGRKGGIRSGEVRRAKKTLTQELLAMLATGDIQEKVCFAILERAKQGNVRAFEAVRDTVKDARNEETTETQIRKYIAASLDLWEYCKLKAPDFYTNDMFYLREICNALKEFEYDDNELLVINAPPRHGKTRTAILASQWYLGRDKSLKLITASYNEKLSRLFSKTVRDNISEIKADENRTVFGDVFPDIVIQQGSATADMWQLEGNATQNYLATSPKATLTGFGGDIIIIDDLIKNAYEANHKMLLEEHFIWFTDTMYSRLEGKRKLVLIMTRWSTKDLAGRIMNMYHEQNRKMRIISKKAFDGIKMLNDSILNKTHYDNLIQTVGEDIVRANYDQEPIDLKGRLYSDFITYTDKPRFSGIYAMCDIADEGKDYLCSIVYGLTHNTEPKIYVLDVVYTQENMGITESKLVNQYKTYNVQKAIFESNFGGNAFAQVIERLSRDAGNNMTMFTTYKQTKNKEARILSNATGVTRNVYMPEHWNRLFPKFYESITEYQRTGNNDHDDAEDCLTAIYETVSKGKTMQVSNLRLY